MHSLVVDRLILIGFVDIYPLEISLGGKSGLVE